MFKNFKKVLILICSNLKLVNLSLWGIISTCKLATLCRNFGEMVWMEPVISYSKCFRSFVFSLAVLHRSSNSVLLNCVFEHLNLMNMMSLKY